MSASANPVSCRSVSGYNTFLTDLHAGGKVLSGRRASLLFLLEKDDWESCVTAGVEEGSLSQMVVKLSITASRDYPRLCQLGPAPRT